MKIKTLTSVREDNISIDKNTEGIVKACYWSDNKKYYYLVQFPDAAYPILVLQTDVKILDASISPNIPIKQSKSRQIDKSEEEFKEAKKLQRKTRKQKRNTKKS